MQSSSHDLRVLIKIKLNNPCFKHLKLYFCNMEATDREKIEILQLQVKDLIAAVNELLKLTHHLRPE